MRNNKGQFIKGTTAWNKGKIVSGKTKKLISMALKGKKINKKQKEALKLGRLKHTKLMKNGRWWTEKRRKQARKSHLGNKPSKKTREKMSMTRKKIMSKELIRNCLRRRPMSGLEEKVNKVILEMNLPYKFVGNGKFFIERINPDFVNTNGKKIAVEVYWKRHKEIFRDGGVEAWRNHRIQVGKKYGWKFAFIEGTNLKKQTIIDLLNNPNERR